MNVHNLLITAILAGVLLYFIGTAILHSFSSGSDLGHETRTLLLEAQSDLGSSKSLTLTLKAGQTLFARNVDLPTRSVAFACSGPECCPTLENCTLNLSSTADRIMVHKDTKTTLTARCQTLAGIHACKVYVGKAPAQLVIKTITMPETLALEGEHTLNVSATVQNTGEVSALGVTAKLEMLQIQPNALTEIERIIDSDEQPVPTIPAGQSTNLDLTILVQQPGEYKVRLTVTGEEAGLSVEERTLIATGESFSLCHRDLTQDSLAAYDSFDQMCRKKLYCAGCDFEFECRRAWQREAPIELPQFYDTDRGEKTFTYLVYPDDAGQC